MVACVTILTLWPTMSSLKNNKKMQLNYANSVCRQILGVANWKLKYHMAAVFWYFFFKRNCSRGSVSLNILSDEWIYARASSWRLWSGDNAYIGPECGTLCLHTLFLPESLLTANNCRLLSHLRTRRGVACLAHLPRVVEINWLEISLGFD